MKSLSAVVVEAAGLNGFFLERLPLAFHFGLENGLNCWTLLFGFVEIPYMSLKILLLSCSRSFMNRKKQAVFFCLTCSISERRFAMVFRLLFLLFPASTGSVRFGLRNTTEPPRTFSLLGFSLIYCISYWSALTCSFKTTSSTFCLWYQLLYRDGFRPIRFPRFFLSVWSGSDSLVSCRTPPNPTSSFFSVTMADSSP